LVEQFLVAFAFVGVAAGSFYAPLTAAATRCSLEHRNLAVALVWPGSVRLDGDRATGALADHDRTDWRTALLALACSGLGADVGAGLLLRRPRPSRWPPLRPRAIPIHRAQRCATPQFAVIAAPIRLLRGAFGPIFHMVTDAIDCGVAPWPAATVIGVAGWPPVGGRVNLRLFADRFGTKEG